MSSKRSELKREKCGGKVRQMWAGVTLGRWLGALSSVYIALTDQAKTARRQKSLQHDLSLQVDASTRQHASGPHMRLASATASICLLGSARHASHALRVCAGGLELIACFSQEGKGSWVCRVHIKVPCLRNCTLNLPATCTRHHGPRQGHRTCSRLLQQQLYLPELITHPAGAIKNLLCSHIKACACFPKINRERYVTGKLHSCFYFPEKTVVISPGLM